MRFMRTSAIGRSFLENAVEIRGMIDRYLVENNHSMEPLVWNKSGGVIAKKGRKI